MNRAKVKNLLPIAASSSAAVAVTVTEPVPFTNPILELNRNRYSRFQSTSAALKLIPKKTMPVFPDSS